MFSNSTHTWVKTRDNKVPFEQIKPFSLSVPRDNDWESSKRRLLIIIEHVDTHDLKARALLAGPSEALVDNVLTYSHSLAKQFDPNVPKLKAWATTAVSFNYFKTYDLDYKNYAIAVKAAGRRMRNLIEDLNPTHVLIFGDDAARTLLKDEEFMLFKRGKVIEHEGRYYVHTVDIMKSIAGAGNGFGNRDEDEDDDSGEFDDESADDREISAWSNLLGFASRCSSHLFLAGSDALSEYGLPHGLDISGLKPNAVFVDTISKIDKLFDYAMNSPIISVDTETDNLNNIVNKLYTIQLGFNSKKGFIVPVDHPDTPFTSKEIQYIKERARDLFYKQVQYKRDSPEFLIVQNGKFDVTQLRQQLKFPLMYWPLYDIQAGEFTLDENLSPLNKIQGDNMVYKTWGLETIAARHGNFEYHRLETFGKGDRANIAGQKFSNKDFLDYMSLDVQLPFALRKVQQYRAGLAENPDHQHFLLTQMSNNIHTFSEMQHRGVPLDVKYLITQLHPNSPMRQLVKDAEKELKATPAAQKANTIICREKGVPTRKGLLGGTSSALFNPTDREHAVTLFFDVLELAPSGLSKNVRKMKGHEGQPMPKLDKWFQLANKDVPEVALYTRIVKLKKLISAYVEAFYKKISESEDGRADSRIRPQFGYLKVVTGRGQSEKPSLQQTPSRGSEAKYIKRMFFAPEGYLGMNFDFSAQEVRGFSFISGDMVLADRFRHGRRIRKRLFQLSLALDILEHGNLEEGKGKPDYQFDDVAEVDRSRADIEAALQGISPKWKATAIETLRKLLPELIHLADTEGDIHVQNVLMIYGTLIDKNDDKGGGVGDKSGKDMRYAIKAVIFGLIYGKGASALADDIKGSKKEAQAIMDKVFQTFKKGARWLEKQVEQHREVFWVESMFGRRRHLYGALTGNNRIISAMDRRAKNSPIQGMGADLGHTSSRLFSIHWHRYLKKVRRLPEGCTITPGGPESMVHDASYTNQRYKDLLAAIQIYNWCATTGVEEYYLEQFGVHFTVPLEIEFAVYFDQSHQHTWDWTQEGLRTCIRAALTDQKEAGYLSTDIDDVMKDIYSDSNNPKIRDWLDLHYPFFKGD